MPASQGSIQTGPAVVCIPMAGRGTRMGELGSVIHKSLLPLGDKAILSRIIESFPSGTEFVVALGEKGEQVQDFLSLAHPDVTIHTVEVDNFDGPGSGPGYSLLCCRHLLQRPFWFVPCDSLYDIDHNNIMDGDWVGVAPGTPDRASAYCNFTHDGNVVLAVYDKAVPPVDDFAIFTGLICVRDYLNFWSALEDPLLIANEHQVSNGLNGLIQNSTLRVCPVTWRDIGDLGKYEKNQSEYINYDFSKSNEFLYILDGRVVKFFADDQVVSDRVTKAKLKQEVFPEIEGVRNQFYSYRFVPGDTLYKINDHYLFSYLLDWLEQFVWEKRTVEVPHMRELCWRFYVDKTKARLDAFNDKHPAFEEPRRVNGRPTVSLSELMANIPWDDLCEGVPAFIHGDLQFDNILYDRESGQFCLLDWRQDFGGEIEFGDLYYDFAKLLGGINLNYDYIKAGLLYVERRDDDLIVDFAQRYSASQFTNILRDRAIALGLSWHRIQLLTGIIYLNMSPMHHPPFDSALMALGRTVVMDALEDSDVR